MGNQTQGSCWDEYEIMQELGSNYQKVKLKANPAQLYELLSVHTSHQESALLMQRVRVRQRDRNNCIQPLIKSYKQSPNYMCSNTLSIQLVYRETQPTLAHHCRYRIHKKLRFRVEEIKYVIRCVGLGLKYLRSIGEKHGLVELNNIIVNSQVYIKDPIVVQSEDQASFNHRKNIRGFPSPQKLRECYDMVSHSEEQTWDLFSLGMVALQMYYLEIKVHQAYIRSNLAYNNTQLNYAFINRLLLGIEDNSLKNWVSILLHPSQNARRNIYQHVDSYMCNVKMLKMLRQNPLQIRPEEQLIEPINPYQEQPAYLTNFPRQSTNIIPVSHVPIGHSFTTISQRQKLTNISPPYIISQNKKSNYINLPINTTAHELDSIQYNNFPSLGSSLAHLSSSLKLLIQTQELQLSKKVMANRKAKSSAREQSKSKQNQKLYSNTLAPAIPEIQDDHSNITEGEFVIEEYEIGTRYQGFKKHGMRNGHGKLYYSQGSCYQGEWKDNMMDGVGTLTYPDGRVAYRGEWKDDQFQGKGTLYNSQPESNQEVNFQDLTQTDHIWVVYEGEMHLGRKQGFGKMQFTNGDFFEGEFFEDEVNGEGKFHFLGGREVRGRWQRGKLVNIFSNV